MRHPLAPCALLALLLLALPAAAGARVLRSESVLPPGQSGYVSIAGTPTGTGSPHLTDQTSLFTSFKFKPATFNLPGAESSPRQGVKIVRDSYGVPAITGDSDSNAWFGVGYAIAEDRLFQLELFKRATSGRLAEILGPEYLDDDLIARRDYYTQTEIQRMIARIPAGLRARAEAYRDGINAYIQEVRENPSKLPGEYAALGVPLSDWAVEDTARVGIFLARTVPSGDGVELDNARALNAIGPSAFSKLLPLRTPGRIATIPRSEGVFPSQPGRTRAQERSSYARSQRFVKGLALPPDDPDPPDSSSASAAAASTHPVLPPGGSYMWAITKARLAQRGGSRRRDARRSPAFTGSHPARGLSRPGNAYLFNGPQLGYSIPELFVEFEVHSPVQNVRGVSAAGIPLVGIGHNGRVAWGFTSGLSDEDDLYAEQLTGQEAYRYRGADRAMDCRDEVFTYRTPPTSVPDSLEQLLGGNAQSPAGSKTERVCRTVHGPVQERADGTAYARRYAIWGRELETIVGLTALNDARDIKDVDRAMRQVTWNENVIAADSRGNIGYWHPGLHPLRPRNYDERLPYPGTGGAEWRGLLPRSRTPHVINPPQGYLTNWNNMPSVGWTNGDTEARERLAGRYHRAGWLLRLVRGVKRRGPSYLRSREIDLSSGTIAQQRPLFATRLRQARAGAGGRARELLDALARWNGSYDRTDGDKTVDPGVAIWEEFKTQAERHALGRFPVGAKRMAGRPGTSHAFDISNGEAYALRTLRVASLRSAAESADAVLTRRFNTADIARWREPRRMYKVTAQGAADPPQLPFYDRGTWQQSVAVGP